MMVVARKTYNGKSYLGKAHEGGLRALKLRKQVWLACVHRRLCVIIFRLGVVK